MDSCSGCKKNKKCGKAPAKAYREFYRGRIKELRMRHYGCDKYRLCKLDKCKKYQTCREPAKKNFEQWRKAYREDNKRCLEQLSRGGI